MYINNGEETKNCNYVIQRKSHYLFMGQFVNVAFCNRIHTSNKGIWVPFRIYFLFLVARWPSLHQFDL